MKKNKNMVTTFNKKDLISFGSYLLSEEREKLIRDSKVFRQSSGEKYDAELSYNERFRNISNADFQNWKEAIKLGPDVSLLQDCTYPEALTAIKKGFWAIRKYAYGRFVVGLSCKQIEGAGYSGRLVFTELDVAVHHDYIPCFADQMADDWIIIYDPFFFKKRED